MSTFAYTRVSSDLQAEKNGTDAQKHAIERWSAANGIPVTHWFEDLAQSGKSMRRPQWQAMMGALSETRGATIVLYDLSRAGRNLTDLCKWIEDMGERGVRVVFVAEGIDLATITGQLLAHVLGAVAEFIRKQTAEKSRSGIKAQLAAGKGWGAGRRKWAVREGAKRGIGTKLTPEEWAAMAARVRAGADVDQEARTADVTPAYARAKMVELGARKGR